MKINLNFLNPKLNTINISIDRRVKGSPYIFIWKLPSERVQRSSLRTLISYLSEESKYCMASVWDRLKDQVLQLLIKELRKLTNPGILIRTVNVMGIELPSWIVINNIRPDSVSDFARLNEVWVEYISLQENPNGFSSTDKWFFFENDIYLAKKYDEVDNFHSYLPMEAVFEYRGLTGINKSISEAVSAVCTAKFKSQRFKSIAASKLIVALSAYAENVYNRDDSSKILIYPEIKFSNLGNETDFFKKSVGKFNIYMTVAVPDLSGSFIRVDNWVNDLEFQKNLYSIFSEDPVYFRALIDEWKLRLKKALSETDKSFHILYNISTYETFLDVEVDEYNDYETYLGIIDKLEEIWYPKVYRVSDYVLKKMNGRIVKLPATFWTARYHDRNKYKGTFVGILCIDPKTFDCRLINFSYRIGAEIKVKDIYNVLSTEEKSALDNIILGNVKECPFSQVKKEESADNYDDECVDTVIHFDHGYQNSPNAIEGGYSWTRSSDQFMGNKTIKFNLAWLVLRDRIQQLVIENDLDYFYPKDKYIHNKTLAQSEQIIKKVIESIKSLKK